MSFMQARVRAGIFALGAVSLRVSQVGFRGSPDSLKLQAKIVCAHVHFLGENAVFHLFLETVLT